MKRSTPLGSDEVRALLNHERELPPVIEPARARSLARARAALVAGIGRHTAVPTPRARWAAAAAMVCVLGAAVGAAAYQIRAHFAALPSGRPAAQRIESVTTPPPPTAPSAPRGERVPDPARVVVSPVPSRADAAGAELRLLRQARAAVAGEDYAGALPPIAAHARRFRDGRLAEEREALRVKALAGLGRTDDARRAAEAFRALFPRSVLLPAVSQMPAAGP